MKRAIIYVRVSTFEQARDGHSIDEQIKRLKLFCEAMGWTVVMIYNDAGFSGATTERPALQKMIRDVKQGKADVVVVYKLDRLSRSQKDTLELIEGIFLKNNTEFVSMTENFDTSSPYGRAMIGILAVFAQLEREQIKERMCMGIEGRAQKGKFHGSNFYPIGYDYIDGELVPNEFEKMQVQMIFDSYASGMSPRKIVDMLSDSGMTHKRGKWSRQAVKYVLSSETYLGYIRHKGELYQGSHEAIIDEDLFNKVQEIVNQRASEYKKHNRRAGKINSYLGGYLHCACCTAKFSRAKRTKTTKNGKSEYLYYICNSRAKKSPSLIKDANCKNKIWTMDELDNIIFGEIRKLALDPNYIAEIKGMNVDDERPRIIAQEIGKLDDQLSKLMDLFSVGSMPMDVLQNKVHELNDKKNKLEQELESLEQENKKALSQEQTLEIVQSFEDVLKTGDLDEIRLVIGSLIDKIEINHDDITIHWTF